jgi:hypothetical protein
MTFSQLLSNLCKIPEFHGHPNELRFRQNQIPGTTIKPEPYNGRESWEEYISFVENVARLDARGIRGILVPCLENLR